MNAHSPFLGIAGSLCLGVVRVFQLSLSESQCLFALVHCLDGTRVARVKTLYANRLHHSGWRGHDVALQWLPAYMAQKALFASVFLAPQTAGGPPCSPRARSFV